MKLGHRSGSLAPGTRRSLRRSRRVARGCAVAPQFTADSVGLTAQRACDLAQPEPPLFHARNRQALVGLQLPVARSLHVRTLLGGRVLHLRFEAAMLDSARDAE